MIYYYYDLMIILLMCVCNVRPYMTNVCYYGNGEGGNGVGGIDDVRKLPDRREGERETVYEIGLYSVW